MKKYLFILMLSGLFCSPSYAFFELQQRTTKSASGVKKVSVRVPVQESGMTVEQENIGKRIARDNQVGSMKHLYIISAYSGDVLIYSPVVGKVTSSGKRLTPKTVVGVGGGSTAQRGMPVNIGGHTYYTKEVIQDDGAYGGSVPYIYWFDATGGYHQHYVSGGQIIHISDKKMMFPKVILNLDTGK